MDLTQLTRYKRDAKASRAGQGQRQTGGGKRKEVTELSRDSLKQLSFVANNCPLSPTHMLTLTYPKVWPSDGKVTKRHLATVIKAMNRAGIQYLWFLEFQARGAPHIHILLVDNGESEKIIRAWLSTVNHWLVDTRASNWAITSHAKHGYKYEPLRSVDGAGRYVAKYAAKGEQKLIPVGYRNVGRFWGHSKGMKPIPLETMQCEVIDLPERAIGQGKFVDEFGVITEVSWVHSVQFGMGANWDNAKALIANNAKRRGRD